MSAAGSRRFTMDEAPRRQRRVHVDGEARMVHNRVTRGSRLVETQPLDSQNPRLAHERMDAKHLPRVTATVIYVSAKGFGFVRLDDGTDVFYHVKESPQIDEKVIAKGLRVLCSVRPAWGNQQKPSAVGLELAPHRE